jgi:peptidoglycan/xylan/chitin deacetylase (PgdA/CDA1 family)
MVPVLTYHSQNIEGSSTANNDHVALAADLSAIHGAGKRVISLDQLMDWLEGKAGDDAVANSLVLTFDDGCDFDVRDIEYPGHGVQRSFLGIMQDFLSKLPPGDTPHLHATSFVIASREAREQIDAGSLFGKGWISDDWWQQADASRIYSVENHGWDHNHPDLEGDSRGNFHTVDNLEQCRHQVVESSQAIEEVTGRRPRYFAYPFGESSAYIRDVYFPEYNDEHQCRAALATVAGHVTRESYRWCLPRFVCGRDWRSPEELLALLG